MNHGKRALIGGALLSLTAACQDQTPPPQTPPPPTPSAAASAPAPSATQSPPAPKYAALSRLDFNRLAVRANLPLFWVTDANKDGVVDPAEVVALRFYPTSVEWVKDGAFTRHFEEAYAQLVQAKDAPPPSGPDGERRTLVLKDLDQGIPTLVRSDLRAEGPGEKAFVQHMLTAASLVDDLYERTAGLTNAGLLLRKLDTESQSLYRRNRGVRCAGPLTERNPACTGLAGYTQVFDLYPADLQKDPKFCEVLEKHKDTKRLLAPFVVVREKAGQLVPVSYSEAYKEPMEAIAEELKAGAKALDGAKEQPLKDYLTAAAAGFRTNDWGSADEAWAKMNATNSRWYVRVGPDETYWEPCSRKAGFHVTFARINTDSLKWQEKLSPIQQEMERAVATLIGPAYKERKVTFHLPDFIDIVVNAGDDRQPMGATVGQSLPNWGKVVEQGRGRTVAMSNLYTDADSLRIRRSQAESLLSAETIRAYADNPGAGLLSTILHEATHNLGPAHEYRYAGKTGSEAFGGPLASMLEELKAQSGALFFIAMLQKKGIIDEAQARQTYVDSIVWSFGHISRGMWNEKGGRKPYSQLAAIQLGFLLDEKAIDFDPAAAAANGTDKGAFTIHFDKLPAAIDKLMKQVATIKATNDKKGAETMASRYVGGDVVPHTAITDRYLRHPKASFVYAVDL